MAKKTGDKSGEMWRINFEFFLKSLRFPICHIFLAKKTGDKSGFSDKSGCDKSKDTLYLRKIRIDFR